METRELPLVAPVNESVLARFQGRASGDGRDGMQQAAREADTAAESAGTSETSSAVAWATVSPACGAGWVSRLRSPSVAGGGRGPG
jgi:hypothetical protein